jgi:tetratricopeptide (TPR) repeat protein
MTSLKANRSFLYAIGMVCLLAVWISEALPETADGTPSELSVVFHSNPLVTPNVIFDTIEFNPWFEMWRSVTISAIEKVVTGDSIGRDISISLVISTSEPIRIHLSSRPPLVDSVLETIEHLVRENLPPHTLVGTLALENLVKVHGGCLDEFAEFIPPRLSSIEMIVPGFDTASMSQKVALLKRWARTDVLPTIGRICSLVDTKFEGVRAFGHSLEEIRYDSEVNVAQLLDSNFAYWRATLEMARGDQLVLAGRVFLLIASGHFDRSRRWLNVAKCFSMEGPAGWYLSRLDELLTKFYTELDHRMQSGIAAYDRGHYQEAMEIYEDVLSDFPHSAWPLHEWLLTKLSMDPSMFIAEGNLAFSDSLRNQVFECDPFFKPLWFRTGRESYFGFRRMELAELLQDTTIDLTEKLLKHADIALDLGQYAFAGHLYWLLLVHSVPEGDTARDVLNRFVYCMRKLHIKNWEVIETNFLGDFDQSTAEIDRELRRRMEEHPAYKSMAVPE